MRLRAVTLALLSAFSFSAFGQTDRGTITGTVSDPAGAVVASAPIQARNTETGAIYESASSSTGNYTIAQLPTGTYEMSVTVPGFKKYVRSGLQVQVAQTIRIDVTLEVGAASESVTVTEAAPLLRTESGELSHNVAAKSMNDLPILGIGGTQSGSGGIRNPMAMVQLIPGTAWIPNSNVRVNGAPSNTQAWRVEGQDASNSGTPGVPQQSQPSVDAIEEVAIQTSNFAAEFGQVGGGVFNVTMKSGSNRFHGTGYNYFANEALNAGQPFTNSPDGNPRARTRRNNYGFTIGGPVWIPKVYDGHDKTFFFFGFEQFRENTQVPAQYQTIPISAYRAGDFSRSIVNRNLGNDGAGRQMLEGMIYDPNTTRTINGIPTRDQFPNNQIPAARFDPVAVRVQNLFPQPQGPRASGIVDNFLNPYTTHRTTQVPSVKIDQVIGAKGKLAFFWQKTKTENPDGNTIFGMSDGLPEPLTTALGTFQNAPLYRLNFDYSLTPTLLLHLGAGYRSNYFLVPSVTPDGKIRNYDAEKELGLKGQIEPGWFPPMTGLLSTNGTGGIKTIGSSAATNQITQSPSFNATVTWVKENHTYKFGSEFRTEGYPPKVRGNLSGTYNFAQQQTGQISQVAPVQGANTGFAYASFLLGLVNQVTIANPATPRLGKSQLGLYAQDTWKVTRKFTLDYGLRYDYSTYLQETYGRAQDFSPTAIHPVFHIPGGAIYEGSGTNRCDCSFAKNYPFAAAPRLGMAYQITPKTVLRAGFGIVYSGTQSNNNAGGGLAAITATTIPSSFGLPVTTLATGIPVSFRPPAWPSYDPALFPVSAVPGTPGPAPALMDQNSGRPARQYQWSIGLQRELMRDLVVEAAYVANRGVYWQAPGLINLNALTPQGLLARGIDITNAADRTLLTSPLSSAAAMARGLNRPPYASFPLGQTVAQSLRPFPQFTDIPVYWSPIGNSWYDSLQVKATKRFSHGLSFLSTFTWQKSLQRGSEIGEPNPGTTGGAVTNDVFNRQNQKYLSVYDQPLLFNISLTYLTPGFTSNKIVKWLARDWSIGTFLQYASGQPIQVPFSQNPLTPYLFNGIQGYTGGTPTGTFANRVPGQPLYTVDLNCHCYDPNTTFVLNPNAWANPAPGTFGGGAAYYDDYRRQRRPNENFNIGRTFRLHEGITFNIRAEFTNVLNRAFWNDPDNTNASLVPARLANGTTSAGFGRVVTTQTTTTLNRLPRQGLIVARITF